MNVLILPSPLTTYSGSSGQCADAPALPNDREESFEDAEE